MNKFFKMITGHRFDNRYKWGEFYWKLNPKCWNLSLKLTDRYSDNDADLLVIEIKPKKLWNTKEVVAKKEAAEEFCKKMGYEYKLVDVEPNSLILKEKYLNGEIKFVEKYKERFEKYAKLK